MNNSNDVYGSRSDNTPGLVLMRHRPSLSVNLPADDGKYISIDNTFSISPNKSQYPIDNENHPDFWVHQVKMWKKTVEERGPSRPTAAQNIGVALYKGERNLPKNETEAVYYFTIAAEAGMPNSMFNLGWAHASGLGVPQSWPMAVYWWKKAAKNGNGSAARNLGLLYGLGFVPDENGVPTHNDSMAFHYYHRAAQLQNIKGMIAVVNCYINGIGVVKDLDLARFWQSRIDGMPDEARSALKNHQLQQNGYDNYLNVKPNEQIQAQGLAQAPPQAQTHGQTQVQSQTQFQAQTQFGQQTSQQNQASGQPQTQNQTRINRPLF